MQETAGQYPAPTAVSHRKSYATLAILIVFLILGVAVGYFASVGSVKHATLHVQVENGTRTTQAIRVLVNNDQVATVNVAAGQTVAVPIEVGWTDTANGMYEVMAIPTRFGALDDERVIVGDGQTLVVRLRVD